MESFRVFGFDKTLFLTIMALVILGTLMVFSSSAILAGEKFGRTTYFLVQHLIGVAAGLALLIILVKIKVPFYQNPYLVYGLLFLTFTLLLLCFIMPTYANTNRWVQLAGLRFQPSELAKISVVLFLSLYFSQKKEKLGEFQTLLFPLAVIILFILLILKEPDYGTGILLFALSALLLVLAGVKIKHFVLIGLFCLGIFAFFLFQASYRLDRISAFLSPEKDPQGTSFQIIQSKLAIGSGGPFGVSIGESTQKLFFLPCAHTDYIFAILGEELGLLGTLTILLLFVLFLWRGLVISMRAPNLAAQLAAAGLTTAIAFQAFLNITIVVGLGPPTGVPLPFFSFGRSSLVCNFLAAGILLNISRRISNSGIKA